MVGPLLGVGSQIVKISFHKLSDIMESERHGPLEGSSSIFEVEGHFPVGEGAPREDESCFVLIVRLDLDLVVSKESIHKGEDLISKTVIHYLINE